MLYINCDCSELDDILDIEDVAKGAMEQAVRKLTAATHAKAVELASQKLHTRRGMFIDALSMFQIDDETFCVNLDKGAVWIDEGTGAHSMLDYLLKSKNVKTAADGSRYVVIPFKINKTKQDMTPAQQQLLATVKKELAAVGATPNKIENDSSGTPKIGLVRSLDIMKAPISTNRQPIGKGPINEVAQGATGGIPLLKGVKIYQKEVKDKEGNSKIQRDVVTFRIASSKHRGEKWESKGVKATLIMDEAMKWAKEEWDNKISPGILNIVMSKLS